MEHTPDTSTSPLIDVSSSPMMLDHERYPAISKPSEVEAVRKSRAQRFSDVEGKVVDCINSANDKKRCKVDSLAVLQKARTDLDEALRWCEKRLAIMEGDYLRRWPNVLNTTPRQASTYCY